MARQTGKQQTSGKTRFLLTCIGVGLLLIGLIADFFWASSSRFKLPPLSISTNWSPYSSDLPPTLPPQLKQPVNSSSNPKPKVHSHVDIYNFTDNTWGGRFDMPKEMAHSHLGMVTDGRYIYIVTGQYGPQCRGPTAHTFILDTETKKWSDMPPLPVPRYVNISNLADVQ